MMLWTQLQSRLIFLTFYVGSPQSFLFLLSSLQTIIHRLNALRLDLLPTGGSSRILWLRLTAGQRRGSEGRDRGLDVLGLCLFDRSASLLSGGFSHCVGKRFQVVKNKQSLRKETNVRHALEASYRLFVWLFSGLGLWSEVLGSPAPPPAPAPAGPCVPLRQRHRHMLRADVKCELSRRPHSILLG